MVELAKNRSGYDGPNGQNIVVRRTRRAGLVNPLMSPAHIEVRNMLTEKPAQGIRPTMYI